TFISEPLDRDMVLAGYSKLMLWVASTAVDMDIFVALRVLDEENREVDFCGPALIPGISTEFYPLAKGWLKASHRKLDTARATELRAASVPTAKGIMSAAPGSHGTSRGNAGIG